MRYSDQPGEYSEADATTAAPVPEAGESDWSPLADDEPDVVADGGGQTALTDWTGGDG